MTNPAGEAAPDEPSPFPAPADPHQAVARCRQRIQIWLDADRILPADGSCLLAALDRALEELADRDAPAGRAGLQAFAGRLQTLIDAGALAVAEGQPPIEIAAALIGSIPSGENRGRGRARLAPAERNGNG